jgi:hypothetical protein
MKRESEILQAQRLKLWSIKNRRGTGKKIEHQVLTSTVGERIVNRIFEADLLAVHYEALC